MAPSSLTPHRKHRKLLKDGSGAEVWPEHIEAVFVQGLRRYYLSPYATHSQPRGRSRWRNQFLVDYLHRSGIDRTKKQVASHIQVLRNMWKGQPEFYLVAAGDDPTPPDAPIKVEDHGDITASFDFDDAVSPDSSPLDCPIDFPPTPTESSPASLTPPKDLPPDPLSYTLAPSAPLVKPVPSYLHYYPNYCTTFRLLADGMTPFSVNLDTLLSSHQPSSSAFMLKLKLSITSVDDTRSPSALHGFSASISLLRVWTNSAKCITRVVAHGVCVSEESAPIQVTNVEYGIANALLPESALTRCRWLDKSLQTQLIQEIIVDNQSLLVLIYDLDRSGGVMPSAELLGYQTRKPTLLPPSPPYRHPMHSGALALSPLH